MTYEFEYLLSTLSSAAIGSEIKKPEQPIKWDELYELASEQDVMPMFAYAVGVKEQEFIPEEYRLRLKKFALDTAIGYFTRMVNIFAALSDLEKIGVKAVVLKGFAVGEFYSVSDVRISGDTDIYVGKEQEKKALNYFRDQGFTIEERRGTSKHAECIKRETGVIEIHAMLYEEFTEKIWFRELSAKDVIKEPYICIHTDIGDYFTLGKTDNMIFLALHLVRHFITKGMGLRQMLDVTIFYAVNNSEIDLERFWGLMESLRFKTLLNTVMGAAIKYCGLPDEWMQLLTMQSLIENELILLNDIEMGGYLGMCNKANRLDSGDMYSQIKIEKNGIKWYKIYMLRLAVRNWRASLSRSKEHLPAEYPYVKDYPLLIPAAWLHRLVVRGFGGLLKGNIRTGIVHGESRISDAGKDRMEMFRQLNLI